MNIQKIKKILLLKGTIGRAAYILGSVIIYLLTLAEYILMFSAESSTDPTSIIYVIIGWVIFIVIILLYATITINRLNDIKLDQRWAILAIIPGLNIILFLFLCYKKAKQYK